MTNAEDISKRLDRIERQNEQLISIIKGLKKSNDKLKSAVYENRSTQFQTQFPFFSYDNYMFAPAPHEQPQEQLVIKRSRSANTLVGKKKKPIEKKPIEKKPIEETEDLLEMSLSDVVGYLDRNIGNRFRDGTVSSSLQRVHPELKKLNMMTGLEKLKNCVLDYVFYCSNMYNPYKDHNLNIVLCGEPGVGKTTVAKMLANILSSLEIVGSDVTSIVASDLTGMHVGETAKNTQAMIAAAPPGVVVIDEVYGLGGPEGTKDFSAEFCNSLIGEIEKQKETAPKDRKMFILLGYEKEIYERIMKNNRGLRSRFPHVMRIDNYKQDELIDIFMRKLSEEEIVLKDDAVDSVSSMFSTSNVFPSNGRSIENLVTEIKMVLARRSKEDDTVVLDSKSLATAFDRYTSKAQRCSEEKDEISLEVMGMYT